MCCEWYIQALILVFGTGTCRAASQVGNDPATANCPAVHERLLENVKLMKQGLEDIDSKQLF